MSMTPKFQWPTMFSGLQGMTWANVPSEISAGITLAALIIPLNIGYAQVAGLPPVFGLYAGIIPLAIFALFTSSRHVVGSPDAPIAAIMGAMLIGFAPIGDPLRAHYALALAVMCGLLFFVFWFFRLAFLANFLSRAVLAGFITGLGIEVLTNQAGRILGAVHVGGSGLGAIAEQLHGAMATSVNTTGYFAELIVLFESIPHANIYSVGIGLGAFAVVRFMKGYAPKAPAALIALIVTTVIVAVFGLDQKGVKVLGAMPSGLPSLTLPNVSLADYLRLLPGAMAVVGITLCEALLLVRSCSRKNNIYMACETHFFILAGILLLQYGAFQSWKGQDRPFWLYDDTFRGSAHLQEKQKSSRREPIVTDSNSPRNEAVNLKTGTNKEKETTHGETQIPRTGLGPGGAGIGRPRSSPGRGQETQHPRHHG